MTLLRKPAALAVAALALAALPTAAMAHEGTHPFKNCTEAYDNGYADIPASDEEHYGKHLDRDGDGVGCDKPPAGFVPADDKDAGGDDGKADQASGQQESGAGSGSGSGSGKDTDLAATGGDDTTPYIAAGGAAVVLAGGGLLLAARRRRGTR